MEMENGEDEGQQFKEAIEEMIKGLMEVHAPVDLHRCCH